MKPTLEIITLLISITTFVGGLIAWYSAAIKKNYAAQRDYNHLKNNYQQLSSSINSLYKDIDLRFDSTISELKDLKSLQLAILVKLSPNDTGGFLNQKH